MTARRRPPRKPGATEAKNGDDGIAVVLEQLRDQRVFLEEQLRDQRVFLEEHLRDQREELHDQRVFLEQMGGQMRVVSERALDTLTRRESLELSAQTQSQMELLKDGLRLTRAEVAARFDDVEQELRAVRQDVGRQAQGSELKALEQRMTAVERHLGL